MKSKITHPEEIVRVGNTNIYRYKKVRSVINLVCALFCFVCIIVNLYDLITNYDWLFLLAFIISIIATLMNGFAFLVINFVKPPDWVKDFNKEK